MNFLIATFGNTSIHYLGALLESIAETYSSKAHVIVSYSDTDQSLIESAKQKAPLVTFHPSKYSLSKEIKDNDKAISSKTKLWNELMGLSNSQHSVFLDSDTIVLKQVDHFFDKEFDIAYAYKTDESENLSWPFNTGVMLAKKSSKSIGFFKEWAKITSEIINNTFKLDQACKTWGGADQAALSELLGASGQSEFCKLIVKNGIKYQGFPCKQLNETRCTPITADTHIVHYKGAWHEVLPKGTFTIYRPEKKCLEIFQIWSHFYDRWIKR